MTVFPTLPVYPSNPLTESLDPAQTIKSQSEGGYVKTRPRFTRNVHVFNVSYAHMVNADKQTLQTFADSVGAYGGFTWTHPISLVSYNVRFDAPPQFTVEGYNHWTCTFTLKEM